MTQRFEPWVTDLGDSFEVRAGKSAPLYVSSRRLANAIRAEWQAAGARATPSEIPLARLALEIMDLSTCRTAVEEAIVAYAETDLVCYRAGAVEADHADRQEHAWGPLLAWAGERFGARLEVTAGIVPHPQPQEAVDALARAVTAYPDTELVALRTAVRVCGSLVIALALLEGEIEPMAAWEAAHLDERVQAERWGPDPEREALVTARLADLETVAEFLSLTRDG